MNKQVLVTIGIPNYNYSNYIVTALNSVVSQTYFPIELIIIDDCSTDNSVEVIENWIKAYKGNIDIMFLKNAENEGLTKVCNKILSTAGGKYFQVLDADDLLLPKKIATQVLLMEAAQNTALIYSNIGVIDSKGKIINSDYLGRIGYNKYKMPEGDIFEQLFNFNFIPLPSVLINTENARFVGGFDTSLQVQDYYLWIKLSEKYETIYLPENTALYRFHSSSMSNNEATNPKSIDSILKIKYRYYNSVNENIKRLIRKDVDTLSAFLFKLQYQSAKEWLKINFILNPSFKSIVYYLGINIGIPYGFFDKLKTYFFSKK